MAITGTWRTQRVTRSDGSSRTQAAPRLGRPELSAEHMEYDPADDAGPRAPWRAVRAAATPSSLIDGADGYDLEAPARTPGRVLDRSPITHEGTSLGGGQTLREAAAEGHRARSIDEGAQRRQLYAAETVRGVTEVRTTEDYELAPISAGARNSVWLGNNSLPESNPEGFRNGRRVRRWHERKIPGSGLRRHNLAPLVVHTAAAPIDSPAPDPSMANRNASPYGLNILSRRRVSLSPVARRTPQAWDEEVVSDGAPAEVPAYSVWGL